MKVLQDQTKTGQRQNRTLTNTTVRGYTKAYNCTSVTLHTRCSKHLVPIDLIYGTNVEAGRDTLH